MEAKSCSAQIVEVIEVKTVKGKGTDKDPMRIIVEYWSKDGQLLAVNDPNFNLSELQSSHARVASICNCTVDELLTSCEGGEESGKADQTDPT